MAQFHETYDEYLKQRRNDALKIEGVKKRGWNCLIFTYAEDVHNVEWVRLRMEQIFGKR
jgi:hypothetical protein